MKQLSVGNEEISAVIEKHADMVRRICRLYLKNNEDVEDVFQDVFLKLFLNFGSLQDEQHQKAWICRVTFNKCKDICKSFWRKKVVGLEDNDIPFENPEQSELMQTIMQLSFDQKKLIYLHYYEGRSIPEIAKILHKNQNTIYSVLKRAKERIKSKVGEI
jgi:RNA polymerase sigma factor (sigma-70 family)